VIYLSLYEFINNILLYIYIYIYDFYIYNFASVVKMVLVIIVTYFAHLDALLDFGGICGCDSSPYGPQATSSNFIQTLHHTCLASSRVLKYFITKFTSGFSSFVTFNSRHFLQHPYHQTLSNLITPSV